MCARYNLTSPPEALRAYFGLGDFEPFPPRYNIAPTQPVAIVHRAPRGVRELRLVRWGLIPGWAKDPRRLSTLINARAETAHDKPSFRGGMRHRRCLVPADGFYEWKGTAGKRTPFLFKRPAGGPLALGAIREHWLGADGSELETMAILTVPANGAVAPYHDRMPLLIEPDSFEAWLDCRSGETHSIAHLVVPPPDDALVAVEVSRALNDPAHEGARLLEPEAPRLL